MSSNNFLKGASTLVIATFIAKFIGAFYRIPLTNILGAEGMGIYQLIFPIYSLILSSSSGALPIAISLIVSKKNASGDGDGIRKLVNSTVTVLFATSLLTVIALIALSGTLSKLQGSSATQLGYLAIAPAILFVSGIAVFRGYFQGNNNMLPSAVSQISEGVVKLIVGLTLAYLLMPFGAQWAVFGALIGVTVSEVVTFVILLVLYRKHESKLTLSFNISEARANYKEILAISIPITIGGIIIPITQFVDSFLVVNILVKMGISLQVATASYGIFTGPVSTLINLPIVVGLSLGIAVVPQLSKVMQDRDINAIKHKSDTALKLALVVGVPFAFFYAFLSNGILTFLYPTLSSVELHQASILLKIGAFTVISLSLMQIFTSILQGLGYTYKPVKNMAVGAGVKIILDIALLPFLGIYGVAIASLIAFTLSCLLNFLSLYFLTGKSETLGKNSGIIMAVGVIMGGIVFLVNQYTDGKWATIVSLIVGGLVYILVLLRASVFTSNELLSLPFGKRLNRLAYYDKIKKE